MELSGKSTTISPLFTEKAELTEEFYVKTQGDQEETT